MIVKDGLRIIVKDGLFIPAIKINDEDFMLYAKEFLRRRIIEDLQTTAKYEIKYYLSIDDGVIKLNAILTTQEEKE